MLGFTHCGRGIGQFVEVIMQDRPRSEWARLAVRGLELLEDDRASVVRGPPGGGDQRQGGRAVLARGGEGQKVQQRWLGEEDFSVS